MLNEELLIVSLMEWGGGRGFDCSIVNDPKTLDNTSFTQFIGK
jgi:hypothetical protein